MDIDKLEAGPELDRLIAEKVMGWTKVCMNTRWNVDETIVRDEGYAWCALPDRDKERWQRTIEHFVGMELQEDSLTTDGTKYTEMAWVADWHPSTEIAAAYLVLDALSEDYSVTMQHVIPVSSVMNGWLIGLLDSVYPPERSEAYAFWAMGDTLQLAICKVSLKAKEQPIDK